jgi:UDP-glucuronate 4-epimerase
MDKILVTGGAGFIGSHVCEQLLRQGKQVAIVGNLDDFYDISLKKANLEEIKRAGNYEFFQVDIRDEQRLGEIFETARPEAVVHLAARAGVRLSLLYPDSYVTTNVQGTARLLELSQKLHVKKSVFASSSSAYGKFNRVPTRC